MSIIRWEPQRELERVGRSMRRLFEDFDNNFLTSSPVTGQRSFAPMVDINEDKENLYFIAELPGMKSEDVKVTVSEGVLTIRGEKKRETEHQDRNFYRMERSYGQFVRQFSLPEDVKDEDIQAYFMDGLLEIVVPKAEPSKPKEREITIGSTNGNQVLTNGHKTNGQKATDGQPMNVKVNG